MAGLDVGTKQLQSRQRQRLANVDNHNGCQFSCTAESDDDAEKGLYNDNNYS